MTEDIRIIHGDCLAVMATLEEGSINAIVTDPPYGIGFVKKNTGIEVAGRWSCRRNAGPIQGDDQPFDPTPFLRWPCVLFGADHFHDRLPPGGSFHAWNKLAHSRLEDSFSDVEFIWSSQPGRSRIITHLWKGVQQASEKGRPKYHVSQKPVAVMAQLLKWFTKPGDMILDPFGGSGTTAVACLKTGRRCIIIESDPKYIQVIHRRIRDNAIPLLNAMEGLS